MENKESNTILPEKPKKENRFFRFVLKFILFIVIAVITLLGAGVVIGYYYQDEVKEYVIGELNKQLNTQVIVDGKDIDFTVIKSFPYASINFKNIKALDAIPQEPKDTLFNAKEISLQFNLIDIFKKEYKIKKLTIDDTELNIRIDKEGNDNFHFWKESNDTSASNFSFELEKIVLTNTHIVYNNKKARQYTDLTVKKCQLSGNFSTQRYTLETENTIYVKKLKIEKNNYLNDKTIYSNVSMEIDNELDAYKIKEGHFKIEDLAFDIYGNIVNTGKNPVLNLGIKGKDMDIRSVLSLIPEKHKEKINNYKSDGEFYFNATVQGSIGNDNTPEIKADFGINNATITQSSSNITLERVNLKGSFFNGNKNATSTLTLNPVSFTINQGLVNGNIALNNLNNPSFAGKVNSNINLTELQQFLKLDTIESVAGSLKIDAEFSADAGIGEGSSYDNINTNGTLNIVDASVKIKNNKLSFSNLNGDFKFNKNDLIIDLFKGNISNTDFELKGFFRNIITFLIKEDQDMTIEASLNSKNVNLNELLENKNEEKKESAYKLKFSEHINVNLNTEIEHLEFRKFSADKIHGVIKLKDQKLFADPLTVNTMNGSITTSGMVDASDSSKILVTCYSDVNKINVTKMFEQFENFGQTAVTSKNIKGVATAKINFASVLAPDLKMDLSKLYAAVDMTIENGELNNVESMKSMSRFIELKDLENVKFATLKNQIEIKDQKINIPKMEVKSNAINITASGTHTFSNEINYKIKLSLNELLAKKAKKAKKENEEFGEVADDGLGRTNIFLSMTGTINDPVIKYDSKSAIQNVKEDLKVEKQTLKTILKEEFGLFKKDSTLKSKPTEEKKFTIQWEEADKKEEKKELKKPKKPEEDDF
ncbi:MAG: hypothetical protein L6Q66_05635 [Bacteroidia bacterium]|nr:hypothetical protein [Bacteroidia bacterium]